MCVHLELMAKSDTPLYAQTIPRNAIHLTPAILTGKACRGCHLRGILDPETERTCESYTEQMLGTQDI